MEWISVKDKLPKSQKGSIYSETVLAIDCEENYPFLAVYVEKYNEWCEHDEAPDGRISCITHWMPLPHSPRK